MKEKKPYASPKIESERVDLPQAWACNIYNMKDKCGRWSGVNLKEHPNFVCT
jgi:hypothetical protein